MTYEEVFLQSILENPEEDTPRRIFADWLLDQQDPVQVARGEFIHLQCDLARSSISPSSASLLALRESQLLDAHSREWGIPFQKLGCSCWEYRRGFVSAIGLPASAWLTHGSSLFHLAPIEEVKLYQAAPLMAELANFPYLSRVRVLDLELNDLTDSDLELLAGSPYLTNLTTLLLWSNRLEDAAVIALSRAVAPQLTRLDLSGNLIGNEGILALAKSPLLSQLTLLDLGANRIDEIAALALAASPFATSLCWLNLCKNPISVTGQNALRDRFGHRVHVWG